MCVQLGRVLACAVGGVFVGLQVLAYHGYTVVNYEKIEEDVTKLLDVNNDGKIDINDAESLFNNVNKVVGYNMPSGGGFVGGLVLGLRQ